MGFCIWALGVACAVGVTIGSGEHAATLQDGLDDLVSRYMLPIGGLLIAIAAGWLVLPADMLSGFQHMVKTGSFMGRAWQVLIRYFTPVMVTLVLLWQVGVFDNWLKSQPPPVPESELSQSAGEPADE